ncbi:polysaccharide deacetylase [Mucilaginibacter sp. PPCGB 2223]|uniref:polysaccharide deacetylase family protein n=1 Tax=Mucilaginibacter sp. PPCGB 2223 TaxID=1886027 RepID=UPI0008241D02|nr:polysaccharide deacetylase [Mucilaginibacter sp. PPCGB 2223]OCX51424.1 polysaccharide deacetylase [Mucilaginibacter sp. PPCGB 2223]
MAKRFYLFVFFLFFAISTLSAQTTYPDIKNYQVYFGSAKRNTQDWLVLRRFEDHNKSYLLLLDPRELETKVDEASLYQVNHLTIDELRKYFAVTAYVKALSKAESQDKMIQDAGIQTGMPKETGITLTADLCPSHRPLDRRIFTDIFNEFKKVEQPVPIALSVTGIWMRAHQADLAWLKDMQAHRQINITWINHSFNHRVNSKAPLTQNFLLEKGTDIYYEVTETEKAMLKNGLLPSCFFRFPGLVSDAQLVDAIINFGLIPIGTDAWLAKGQQPQNGSIVLIHGNGNEPVGVADFIKLIQSKKRMITNKQWLLYDLRESVEDEFGN